MNKDILLRSSSEIFEPKNIESITLLESKYHIVLPKELKDLFQLSNGYILKNRYIYFDNNIVEQIYNIGSLEECLANLYNIEENNSLVDLKIQYFENLLPIALGQGGDVIFIGHSGGVLDKIYISRCFQVNSMEEGTALIPILKVADSLSEFINNLAFI